MNKLPTELKYIIFEYELPRDKMNNVIEELNEINEFFYYCQKNFPFVNNIFKIIYKWKILN